MLQYWTVRHSYPLFFVLDYFDSVFPKTLLVSLVLFSGIIKYAIHLNLGILIVSL